MAGIISFFDYLRSEGRGLSGFGARPSGLVLAAVGGGHGGKGGFDFGDGGKVGGDFGRKAVADPVFGHADGHKALPEFEKESFDVRQERVLELLFAVAGREGDEVEGVGVLRDFLRQVAFAFRKTGREIRERLALPLVQFRVEEVQKNRNFPHRLWGNSDRRFPHNLWGR